MTSEELIDLKRQLGESEALHHKIMAKMADPAFDLLDVWVRKERIDHEIGSFIRRSVERAGG